MAALGEKQPLPPDQTDPNQYGYNQTNPPQQQHHHQQQYGENPQQPPQSMVVIQEFHDKPRGYDNYDGKCSFIIGIMILVFMVVTMVLNGIAFSAQRDRAQYDMFGNLMVYLLPSLWCSIMILISGAFAIAAGRTKSRGLVITHLVLGVIASVIAFGYAAVVVGAMIYDISAINSNRTRWGDKVSLAMTVIWFMMTLTMLILIIWATALPCKVVCCRRSAEMISIAMVAPGTSGQPGPTGVSTGGTVTYQHNPGEAPPPYQ